MNSTNKTAITWRTVVPWSWSAIVALALTLPVLLVCVLFGIELWCQDGPQFSGVWFVCGASAGVVLAVGLVRWSHLRRALRVEFTPRVGDLEAHFRVFQKRATLQEGSLERPGRLIVAANTSRTLGSVPTVSLWLRTDARAVDESLPGHLQLSTSSEPERLLQHVEALCDQLGVPLADCVAVELAESAPS